MLERERTHTLTSYYFITYIYVYTLGWGRPCARQTSVMLDPSRAVRSLEVRSSSMSGGTKILFEIMYGFKFYQYRTHVGKLKLISIARELIDRRR